MDVASVVREAFDTLRGGGYRGLIVIFGRPEGVYSTLSEALGDTRGLLVYWPGVGVDAARKYMRGWRFVFVSHLYERLGEEYDVVVIDAFEGLQANTLAAAAEMVRGGGVLVLAGRGWESLSAPESEGRFSRWLRNWMLSSRNTLILDVDKEAVLYRGEWVRGPSEWLPGCRLEGVPAWLSRLACCDEQALVAVEAERLVKSYEAGVLLVTGDRGRGKSAAAGLATAYLISRRLVGDVTVTAPSVHSVQSFFLWLARGLRAARIRYKAWGPGELYLGIKGAWFRVRYVEPWRAEPAPLTVIDEAAAIGPARVRRIAGRSRNVIAVTTVHGYEGSGRYWLRVLTSQLPPTRIIELKTPVRFAPGDPLEELLMNALMLRTPSPEELEVCKRA